MKKTMHQNNWQQFRQRPWWQSALLLALFTALAVFLLSLTQILTRDTIAKNAEAMRRNQLQSVFPSSDQPLLRQPFVLPPALLLGQDLETIAYFAIKDQRFHGVALEAIAPDGYNGAIHLLIGIDQDGVLQGVRVLAHQETPGLGDPIEERRSDWIDSFNGKSLENARFALRKEGGDFDAFTGATITPRAVVRAVKKALEYFSLRKSVFEQQFEEKYGQQL